MFDVTTDPRFRIERDHLAIGGLSSRYRLFQMSDSHMSLDSPLDSEDDRQKAAHLREVWLPHGNGLTQEENFNALVAHGRAIESDLFLFAGDMSDFPSPGTAAAAKALYGTAGNYLYTPGNHERAWAHPAFFADATGGDPAVQVRDLGELRFVAVDNAAHSVPDRVMETLIDVLYGDKPVILLHHTPVDCPTLHPYAAEHWDDVTYFLFGLPGGGENVEAYIRLLTRERTRLKAVVAGHLHHAHVDVFENGVKQYISAPCLQGYARVIDIS